MRVAVSRRQVLERSPAARRLFKAPQVVEGVLAEEERARKAAAEDAEGFKLAQGGLHAALDGRMTRLAELTKEAKELPEQEQVRRKQLMLQCNEEQAELQRSVARVRDVGQALGVTVQLFADMQTRLQGIASDLEQLRSQLSRVEQKVDAVVEMQQKILNRT